MKVNKLMELLSHLNPEAELKIGGWKTAQYGYTWDSESLEDKHITFSHDTNDKLTVHLELDV
jgi:hypothetical protein